MMVLWSLPYLKIQKNAIRNRFGECLYLRMTFFITGISTDVGKTVAAAIVAESLGADYWKPIQAGDLHITDTMRVDDWLCNGNSVLHPERFRLNTPASPHLAAEIDGISVNASDFQIPQTQNHLVIEGAGGWLVPINDREFVADIVQKEHKIILVSRHYLGSINHTLLTAESIAARGFELAGIIFNGDENAATESIILKHTKALCIGRIGNEKSIGRAEISKYADAFRPKLQSLL